jgi:hypothetical protein
MHHQTTAYHPEANSAVGRLHCSLKDALCAHAAAAATWAEELPWVLGTPWTPFAAKGRHWHFPC